MADEERQENENAEPEAEAPEQAEDAAAEEPAADEAPAEEQAAEDAPAEEPEEPSEEPVEAPAAKAPAARKPPADEEPEAAPGPKELRKSKRSRAGGPARPERSDEERAGERVERRRANAARRRRYREGQRRKRGEPRPGTPPAERDAAGSKVRQGTVISSKGDKTITVRVELVGRHRRYEKVVRRTRTLHVHDEANQAGEGDVVRVIETRPLSRTKRWRLVEILERAR